MKCPMCSKEFNEAQAEKACTGCPMNKGCKLIRCPNCGYEIPEEPASLKFLKNFFKRLLSDVLQMKKGLIHEASCDFEHALHKGVDENVCTLLGHPRTCPHGSEIPEGACCKEQRAKTGQLITTLSDLAKRKSAIVAYLRTDNREDMQKLIAMGVLPGTAVQVLQRFPTIAFQAGKSQFAVDRDLADKVVVRQSVR